MSSTVSSLIRDNTPWEDYDINGTTVHVKREDLATLPPLPFISKYRGVERYFRTLLPTVRTIGVLDSSHSSYGSGVSTLCQRFGLECFAFYPATVVHNASQEMAQLNRAQVRLLRPNRSKIMWHQANRTLLQEAGPGAIMLPIGLHMVYTSEAVALEVKHYTPDTYRQGTWLIPFGRGAIASGLIPYLMGGTEAHIVLYLGSSRSVASTLALSGATGYHDYWNRVSIVDEGYKYSQPLICDTPWRTSKWYETKAYNWLSHHIHELTPPIIFWNTGAD